MVAFLRRPVPRFAVEFLGMCAAMCVGGRVLSGAFFDGLGFETLAQRSLASAVLVIVVSLGLPMAVYMGLRGHWWRHNLTMNASTVAVGAVLVAASSVGLVARSSWNWHGLFGWVCTGACVLMFIEMLFSFDMYSGRKTHHGHAHTA